MEKMLEHRINEYHGAFSLFIQREDDSIRQKLASTGMLQSGLYIKERIDLFNKVLVGFKDNYGQERPSLQDFYYEYFSDFPNELNSETIKEIVDRENSHGEKVAQHFPPAIQQLENNEGIRNFWSNSIQAIFQKVAQQTGMKLSTMLKKNTIAAASVIRKTQNLVRSERLGEIQELIDSPNRLTLNSLIDKSLVSTGIEQSDLYQVLFLVENFLRRFIETKCKETLGHDYLTKISIGKETKNLIAGRKRKEADDAWIRTRGESDLFYLDFNDLGYIIKNNWSYFEKAFPTQQWIQVKIDELYKCRCLIAHNSMVGAHEMDVVWTNSKSILLQLSDK